MPCPAVLACLWGLQMIKPLHLWCNTEYITVLSTKKYFTVFCLRFLQSHCSRCSLISAQINSEIRDGLEERKRGGSRGKHRETPKYKRFFQLFYFFVYLFISCLSLHKRTVRHNPKLRAQSEPIVAPVEQVHCWWCFCYKAGCNSVPAEPAGYEGRSLLTGSSVNNSVCWKRQGF